MSWARCPSFAVSGEGTEGSGEERREGAGRGKKGPEEEEEERRGGAGAGGKEEEERRERNKGWGRCDKVIGKRRGKRKRSE